MIIPVLNSCLRVATPDEIGGRRFADLLETQNYNVSIKGVIRGMLLRYEVVLDGEEPGRDVNRVVKFDSANIPSTNQ